MHHLKKGAACSRNVRNVARCFSVELSPPTMILCPGQGSQSVGMLSKVNAHDHYAKEIISASRTVLKRDLLAICRDGPINELMRTTNCQPAVMMATLLAFNTMHGEADNLSCVAGYSVGEISALVLGGVISVLDAFRLIKGRAEAMQSACDRTPSSMASISGLALDCVSQMCDDLSQSCDGYDHVTVAIDAYPNGAVVGGATRLVERLLNREHPLLTEKVQVQSVTVSGAFHTSYMSPARDSFHESIDRIEFNAPQCPLLSNVTARPHQYEDDRGDLMKRLLTEQLVARVQWSATMQFALNELSFGRHGNIYEVGCGRQLRGMLARFDRGVVRRTKGVEM